MNDEIRKLRERKLPSSFLRHSSYITISISNDTYLLSEYGYLAG